MKKWLLLMLFILQGLVQDAKASHLGGVDLWYEYNGTNYTVNVTYTKMCTGPSLLGLQDSVRVFFYCPSRKDTFDTYIHVWKKDTTALGCGYNSCDSISLQNAPAHIVWSYADTFTLPAAPDWRILTSSSAWAPATNIVSGSSATYVEAYLDNSSSHNSSAILSNDVGCFIPVGQTARMPLSVIDVDGDSVVCEFVAPLNVNYQSGYSFNSPFGAGTNVYLVDNSKQELVFRSTNQGVYAFALKATEYRNGVAIASHMRDFVVFCLPMATGLSEIKQLGNLRAKTCPGKNNSFAFDFESSNPNDSVFLEVLPASSTPYSVQGSVVHSNNRSTIYTSFQTPSNASPATTPYIIYLIKATATQAGCTTAVATYGVKVDMGTCVLDSIWAGDTNDDNVANLFDVLPIAMNYGDAGYTRPFRSINWFAQYADDWNSTWNWTGKTIDLKHVDCNGDGVIDTLDLEAISVNYTKTHAKGGSAAKTTAGPDLYFDTTGIAFYPGATVSLPIKLGTVAEPVSNVYAVLTKLKIDGLTLAQSFVLNTQNSWLTGADPAVNFIKNTSNTDVDWVQGRTNKQNTNGSGTIATLDFTIPANIPIGTVVHFRFDGSVLYDKDGIANINFDALDTTVMLKFPTWVAGVDAGFNEVNIIPNPSGNVAVLGVTVLKAQHIQLSVSDIMGKQLWQSAKKIDKGTHRISLPASELPAGVYMVRIANSNGVQQTLKWVKQ